MRRGLVQDGPYDGIPDHLVGSLDGWVRAAVMVPDFNRGVTNRPGQSRPMIISNQLIMKLARMVRLPLSDSTDTLQLRTGLLNLCHGKPDVYLDVLDALLFIKDGKLGESLEAILDEGRSAWTVSRDGRELLLRVDAAATAAFEQAVTPEDVASAELQQAWSRAYGRDADASDAWDHSIKAVEAVLAPIVVPAQDKPQIGHVLGQLRSQGNRWRLVVPGPDQDHAVGPLVTMLQTIWPNPDRHAAGNPRVPNLDEARAVVHLAVTIVQWGRSGGLTLVA